MSSVADDEQEPPGVLDGLSLMVSYYTQGFYSSYWRIHFLSVFHFRKKMHWILYNKESLGWLSLKPFWQRLGMVVWNERTLLRLFHS